LLENKNKRI